MKKMMIAILLAAVLVMAACGTQPAKPEDQTDVPEITTEAPAEEQTEEITEADETAELRAAFEEHVGKTTFREMLGDKTGTWRAAVVNILEGDLIDHVAEYAAAYMQPDEVHFLIPASGDYTLRINKSGSTLMVTRIEHTEGMDFNAEHVNDGETLNEYIVNTETGEIRDLT